MYYRFWLVSPLSLPPPSCVSRHKKQKYLFWIGLNYFVYYWELLLRPVSKIFQKQTIQKYSNVISAQDDLKIFIQIMRKLMFVNCIEPNNETDYVYLTKLS